MREGRQEDNERSMQKQAKRGHQRCIGSMEPGTSREWPPCLLVMFLYPLLHTHMQTRVNTHVPCSSIPHLLESTKSWGKQKCGSCLVMVSLRCFPGWQAGSPLGRDRDPPWRYGLQTSLCWLPTHRVTTNSSRHLFPSQVQTAAFHFTILVMGNHWD